MGDDVGCGNGGGCGGGGGDIDMERGDMYTEMVMMVGMTMDSVMVDRDMGRDMYVYMGTDMYGEGYTHVYGEGYIMVLRGYVYVYG